MKAPLVALVLASASIAHAQCTPGWDTSLGNPSGRITASLTYDDGTGPALYVGYTGKTLGGNILGGVAKLQGQQWVALGNGVREDRWGGSRYWPVYDVDHYIEGPLQPVVHDMVEFDPDGVGPRPSVLVVAISLAPSDLTPTVAVSSWNGTAWSPMGNGLLDEFPFKPAVVNSLAVFDSGSGPKLYATGEFAVTNEAQERFYGVAVWDGARWQPVGSRGFVAPVDQNSFQDGKDLLVHDDGSGSALYVAGVFSGISLTPGTANIARWNGSVWSSVGGGRPTEGTRELVVFDDDGSGGAGPKLFAVGGSISAWSGSAWSPSAQPAAGPILLSASVYNDGAGPALYLGGQTSSLEPTAHLYRFDGSNFTELGDGLHGTYIDSSEFWFAGIYHLAVHNIGGTNRLIAGGHFRGTMAAPVGGNLMWNGSNWVPMFPLGAPTGDIASLNAGGVGLSISSVDLDGVGPQAPAFMVGGDIKSLGGVATPGGLALRQGAAWSTLVDHFPFTPGPLAYTEGKVHVEHKPTGDQIYVATVRRTVLPEGDVREGGVYQLVGNTWAPLGDGLSTLGIHGLQITGLLSADLGAGSGLYAYGGFDSIGGYAASKIASWNGNAWEALGVVPPMQAGYTSVESAAAGDDGTGLALYLAGRFAGDLVVKWNGTTWSSATAGLPARSDPFNYINPVPTLVTLNGSVYAWFTGVREYTTEFGPYYVDSVLYVLNNGTWTEVGAPTTGYVYTSIVGVANPGDGERLYFHYYTEDYEYIPGWFGVQPFEVDHAGVVEFNGTDFQESTALGRFVGFPGPQSIQSIVEADGSTSLWFAGGFNAVGASDPAQLRGPLAGISSGGLARFVVCPPRCVADVDDGTFTGTPDGGVTIDDLLYYLFLFELGDIGADVDNGTFTGTPDGGVTIDDLLYYLFRFENGC